MDPELMSMEVAGTIGCPLREAVVAVCSEFPQVRLSNLNGNSDPENPCRVKWYGLRLRTPEELAATASIAVFCGMTIEVKEGIRPALANVVQLEISDSDVGDAFVGFAKDFSKVILVVNFTTAFRSYGASKYVLEHFPRLRLLLKAGHFAGPFNEETIVVLDGAIDPIENAMVACCDRYNATTSTRRRDSRRRPCEISRVV